MSNLTHPTGRYEKDEILKVFGSVCGIVRDDEFPLLMLSPSPLFILYHVVYTQFTPCWQDCRDESHDDDKPWEHLRESLTSHPNSRLGKIPASLIHLHALIINPSRRASSSSYSRPAH